MNEERDIPKSGINSLNSVLIEGDVEGDVTYNKINETPVCSFKIASKRVKVTQCDKCGNCEKSMERSMFDIICIDGQADLCRNKSLQEGMSIRAVGRLAVEDSKVCDVLYKKVVVLAEHIEFK